MWRAAEAVWGGAQVTYPFHDTGDEVVEGRLIRRARLHVDGHWMCIRPGQSWEDGDVRPMLCSYTLRVALSRLRRGTLLLLRVASCFLPGCLSVKIGLFCSSLVVRCVLALFSASYELYLVWVWVWLLRRKIPFHYMSLSQREHLQRSLRCERRWPRRWSWSTAAKRSC